MSVIYRRPLAYPATSGQGWPDRTNTGVPTGTSLTPFSGNFETSSNGQIIQDLDISGAFVIQHTPLTIRRCRVIMPISEIGALYVAGSVHGGLITFEDCELDGQNKAGCSGIFYDSNSDPPNLVVRRTWIHRVENGVGCLSNFEMYDSLIDDLDPAGADPHTDGLQTSENASDVIIQHNAFRMDGPNTGPNNSCLQFDNDSVTNFRWDVVDNLFLLDPVTGGACVRIPLGNASANDLRVRNNRMTPGDFEYRIPGPPDAATNHITEWSGNVDHLTEAVIP